MSKVAAAYGTPEAEYTVPISVTPLTISRPMQPAPVYAAALLLGSILISACDLTPVPVQQAGGQVNGGTSSAGSGDAGSVASAAGGGAGGATGSSGGTFTAGGGGLDGGAGSGGAPASGSGGTFTGSAGASVAGSSGATAPGNLVANGDFSQGASLWHVDTYAGMESHSVVNGAFCVVLTQNASVTVGWPGDISQAFQISDGAAYEFSYQASVSGSPASLKFEARVGPTATGTNFAGFSATDTLSAIAQNYQHPFTASGSSTSAGIAFNIQVSASSAVTVCIDNVSVSPRA